MKTSSHRLYLWVLVAIAAGVALGALAPSHAVALKPLGDGFVALVKMLIGPIIFCTVTLGIAGAGGMRKVGRVGFKALIYFEVVSSFALVIGLVAANVLRPGRGFDVDPRGLDGAAVAGFAKTAAERSLADHLLHLIPRTFSDAFGGDGDLLQVLLVALLFGYALNACASRAEGVRRGLEGLARVFFAMMNAVMKLAPIGAGAAMAFTVGQYGLAALAPMLKLMICFYASCLVFILAVLGAVARATGFSILRFLAYVRDELLLVMGTSSSESALVPLMDKLERLGCPKSVVGLVVPAGYSFNLDGTNIYLTLATLFVAQALNIELSVSQQASILLIAMLTSKGASGVTGAGFITLAATLAVVPDVPVAGLTLILGVDRFMSEARALTNMVGNGVATLVVSRWEGELDLAELNRRLRAGG